MRSGYSFSGRVTGPKLSGAVLACFWANFHAKLPSLCPIQSIFDDLGPNRHFGRDLDLQDQDRDWPGGPGLAHTFCPPQKPTQAINADLASEPRRIRSCVFFCCWTEGSRPPSDKKGKTFFLFYWEWGGGGDERTKTMGQARASRPVLGLVPLKYFPSLEAATAADFA